MNLQQSKLVLEQQRQLINDFARKLEQFQGAQQTLQQLISVELDKVVLIDKNLSEYALVVKLLQEVFEQIQKQAAKVELICTNALRAIFGNNELTFSIKTKARKNSIETFFKIQDNESGEIDLMHGEAGGTKNIVAAALRLIFAELCSPRVDGPIILDEVGSNISIEYQENFGKFLKKFSSSTGRQIFLISHQPAVTKEADTVIKFTKVGAVSMLL